MELPARRQIATLFREEKRLLSRFVVTSLGQSLMTMAGVLLIKDFLSAVLGGEEGVARPLAEGLGSETAIWTSAVLLLGTYLAASALRYDNTVVQQRIVKALELGMMEQLIRHLLTLSVPFFDRQSHGDIIHAVKQDVSALRAVVLAHARLFLDGTVAIGLLVAVVLLSPRLTFWGLLALPLGVFPIVLIGRRTLARSFTVRKAGYVLFDAVLQILKGIRVIKAYGGEKAEARAAVMKGHQYFDALVEIVRVRALSTVVLQSLAGLSVVLVVVLGGFEVMRGRLTWPSLLAFLMALRALHAPLNSINTNYVQIKRHGASVSRIQELLEVRPEVREMSGALPLEHSPALISFERVSFAYQDTPVLRDVSFTVFLGETIGIAGPSGAGKTTLLNVIARFYNPTEGRVCFDHRDLKSYRLEDVYRNVAIVTQQPFLFAATIRENIARGRSEASFEEIVAAAKAAQIHEDIETLEEGYDTEVGVGGRKLSLGQAQRLSIARALLKKAPLLLLDEATASLDSLLEEKVQQAIDRLMGGRTTFIVAHRLSTLRNAHRILVLDEGRLLAVGTHEELVATCDLYHRMWVTQQMATPSPSPHAQELPESETALARLGLEDDGLHDPA